MTCRRAVLLSLALSPLALGCTSIPMLSSPLSASADPSAVANHQQAMVAVEIRPAAKEPKLYQMPLEGEMCVQDAVEKSRARKKFHRMNVSILRTAPDGRRHKMDCRYEHGKHRIATEYNYAIQQGDYIIISEDTSTIMDDMIEHSAGPLKVLLR